MKANTLKLLIPLIATGGLILIGASRVAASNLTMISISVSYVAVAILFALAVLDYGQGPKSYAAR